MFCPHIYAQVHCIQTKGFAITQLFFMYIVQLCVQGFREMSPNAILRNLLNSNLYGSINTEYVSRFL